MAPILPLLIAAGAGIVALMASGTASAAPKPPGPPPPPPAPPEGHTTDGSFRTPPSTVRPGSQQPPSVVAIDPGMPGSAVTELQRVLATTSDPDRLDALAVLLEQMGYVIAAATVRAKAAELRARGAGALTQKVETVITSPPEAPPTQYPASFDHRIKDTSEVPYVLARRFTGDANRWRELLPLNPNLKVVQKKDAAGKIVATHVEPWFPGMVVKIPGKWLATALASRAAA